MAAAARSPEAVRQPHSQTQLYEFAPMGQVVQDLLAGMQRHEPDYARNRARYLEAQREDGSTPLILAAERGHLQVVELVRPSRGRPASWDSRLATAQTRQALGGSMGRCFVLLACCRREQE
jgi:hypothetical protein